MVTELEHLSNEERLRELTLFSVEKRKLREILSASVNMWKEAAMRTEPDSLRQSQRQWAQSETQEVLSEQQTSSGDFFHCEGN